MWKEGVIGIHGVPYLYWIKVYKTRSQYGIDGGRISKLMIKRHGETVCNYDRGWDIHPVDDETKIVYEILIQSEN